MGGGTHYYGGNGGYGKGLSPRGRGNPGGAVTGIAPYGSIPAWAGEPQGSPYWVTLGRVYPRVGGGTNCDGPLPVCAPGLSPRGRGNRREESGTRPHQGSIPAWAGEPHTRRAQVEMSRVYPRVGGGTGDLKAHRRGKKGLSPRGRGNHLIFAGWSRQVGSIPAWAGEPPC